MQRENKERIYPYSDLKITKYVSAQIDILRKEKSQKDIAKELGYQNPNIISMFKRGETKIPLEKIPGLAKALHIDARHLFRLAMEDYWPDQRKVLEDIVGRMISLNEYLIVQEIRRLTNDKDVALTADLRKRLRVAFG